MVQGHADAVGHERVLGRHLDDHSLGPPLLRQQRLQLLEQGLAGGRQVFGDEHAQVAHTLNYLGAVLADKGDYRAAGQRLEEAMAMRRKLLGP